MNVLPKNGQLRFLEVGCYPGTYMWYFNHFFDYQVSGMEYVDWCSERVPQLLLSVDVACEVIHCDVLTYQLSSTDLSWDVVASFGLIEHFIDTDQIIQKHLDLVKPGGYMVLVIPSHHGLYGHIVKLVDSEAYITHNQMSYDDILDSLSRIGQVEILAGGYYGRLGFWATGLYQRFERAGRLPYLLFRGPLWILEQVGRVLPNTSFLSPYAAVVARKMD